jgi:hypothetical protein
MKKNLSDVVSCKKTAQNRFLSLLSPVTYGFFRDNSWQGPGQVFRAIRAMGGEVDIESTNYFDVNGVSAMGKKWILSITANGFVFPAVLTASFADKQNGDVYDLTITI